MATLPAAYHQLPTFSFKIAVIRFDLQVMKRLPLLYLLLFFSTSFAQTKTRWVDSVFNTMSLKEKVGQLFMVPITTYTTLQQIQLDKLNIAKYKPGSIWITKSDTKRHTDLVNSLQKISKVPLLFGIYADHGVGDAIDSSMRFPSGEIIGANTSLEKIEKLGFETAKIMRSIGIQIDFTLTYSYNKGANFFGSNALRVSEQFNALNKGLRNGGVMPVFKQYAFLKDSIAHYPLAFADIVNLKASIKKKNGKAERHAFSAGNDVLVFPDNIDKAIKKIYKLTKYDNSKLAQLNKSVKKILEAKYDAGLYRNRIIESKNIDDKIFSPEAILIDEQLKQGAITLLRNENSLIPLRQLDNKKFKLITINSPSWDLHLILNRYVPFDLASVQNVADTLNIEKELQNYTLVIAVNGNAKPFGKWIKKISNLYPTVVCHFGDPAELSDLKNIPVLIEGYDHASTRKHVAEAIFGAIPTEGSLPFEVKDSYREGTNNSIIITNRISYSVPEDAALDSKKLVKVDSIAQEALTIQAAPGARIMIARKGKVIYDKSFGWQSSDKKIPVTENTIYDLASVTKITATLQAVMFMHERGLIDINKKISLYLSEFKNTNKQDIIIKDILTHQAGLWPYFPWHVELMKDSAQMKFYFSKTKSDEYPFLVSKDLFSHKSMRDSMWSWIVKSKMIEKKDRLPYEYRYSDLGLYIMQRLAQTILNQPIEDFVAQNFYEPMGATTTGFHPLQRFPENIIAPTENDTTFRKSLLTGYVHDPGSAMFGGVAGHAGLFSNANDLLKLGQMWLQKGSYGGTQYFKPETIDLFTSRTYATSRRGLGWDKPTGDDKGSTGILCSPLTFGHTGFTGTCIWVDPQYDLVFVFLSNRVNPDVSPKLLSANIRTRIQDTIYEAIKSYDEKH